MCRILRVFGLLSKTFGLDKSHRRWPLARPSMGSRRPCAVGPPEVHMAVSDPALRRETWYQKMAPRPFLGFSGNDLNGHFRGNYPKIARVIRASFGDRLVPMNRLTRWRWHHTANATGSIRSSSAGSPPPTGSIGHRKGGFVKKRRNPFGMVESRFLGID